MLHHIGTPAYLPYPPLQGCDAAANAWCDQNCPHFAEFGSLLARLDEQHVPEQPLAWRCYARHTLDETAQKYAHGKAYCTRQLELARVIEACVAQREAQPADASAVAIDASGGVLPSAHHAIPELNATRGAGGGSSGQRDGEDADASSAPRIGLVVAHCHEPMAWLGEVQRGLRDGYGGRALRLELHIYEKCDDRSEDSWPRLGWQHERRTYLSNLGEECFAYLHYLVDLYDVLPEAVIFFQGDGVLDGLNFYHKSRAFAATLLHSYRRRLAARLADGSAESEGHGDDDFASPFISQKALRVVGGAEVGSASALAGATDPWWNIYRSVNDHQYIAVGGSPEECSRLLTSSCMRGPPRLFECVQELNDRHAISHGAPLGLPPRAYAMYTNAQFGVTRDRIRARPLAAYEALLREFEKPHEKQCLILGGAKGRPHRGTCALFEYMWHAIFGEPPILDPRLTMSGESAYWAL